MNNNLAVFLPVRKGSERVKDKNTKPFAGYPNGLLELKINTLINTPGIDTIVISSNDPKSLAIAEQFKSKSIKISIDVRPDYLGSSQTSLVDLVNYVPSVIKSEHILWTHVTSPFLTAKDYESAIIRYKKALTENYDSLMSVLPFRNFLWSSEKNDIINRVNNEKWPRTQDLLKLYEIDSGIFIAPRSIYLRMNDRIGKLPYLYESNKIKSFDVDWEEDFEIAEALFKKLHSTRTKY